MLRLPESGWQRNLLALMLGASGVLAFAPFNLFWLAPAVWMGWFLLLRAAPNPRAAALNGFCFGAGFFLAGTSWVYVSLSVFGGMPWWLAGTATLLFCATLALLPTLAGFVFKHWQPAEAWRQALWFGTLCFAADWLRGWLFTGFPWLALGYSQTPPSPLAGWAPLLGVYGLSLLIATLGAGLAHWRVGIPLLFGFAAAGWGLQQIEWTQPHGAPVSVALVQGNIPQDLKFRPEQYVRTLRSYHALIETHPAQLTVLPETAFPAFFDQLPPEYLESQRRLAQRQKGDLLFGVPTGEGKDYWNSAVSLGASPEQRYHKQHLVPFGEEIIAALPQATLLVNLSNTAWFGRSLAQPQHLQIAQMRALETGRPMLRATNTGMTAVLTAKGGIQAVLPPFTTAVLQAEVRGHRGLTPFARWGNGLALALGLAGLLAVSVRRKTK